MRVNNRSESYFKDIELLKRRPEYVRALKIAKDVVKKERHLTPEEYQFFREITFNKGDRWDRNETELFEYPFYKDVSDKKCQEIYENAMNQYFLAPMKRLASEEVVFNCNFKFFTAPLLIKMDKAKFPFVRMTPNYQGIINFCYTKDHYHNVIDKVSKGTFYPSDYLYRIKYRTTEWLQDKLNKCIKISKDRKSFKLDFRLFFTN